MDEKNINWIIDDGDAFFAHEVSINFTPLQVVVDFKNITPRIDSRVRAAPVFKVKHDVILLDPFHAQRMHVLLGQVLARYEKEFGKIKKPKPIEIAEKKRNSDDIKEKGPNYFG